MIESSEEVEKIILSLLGSWEVIDSKVFAPFVSVDNEGEGVFSISIVIRTCPLPIKEITDGIETFDNS